MSESLVIASHCGLYRVDFDRIPEALAADGKPCHVIVDSRVADLHGQRLASILDSAASVLRVEATEDNKSLDAFPLYVEHLVAHGLRRDHMLLAIGGGIIQDITCFLASTMLRGVDWHFIPTTLLAQADSCIGSKSSVNCGAAKNILGTFKPPRRIVLDTRFLETLDRREIHSGVGEILKVHAIAGAHAFDTLAAEFDALFTDDAVLNRAIRRALEIKKGYIETDEFDTGPRLVFNFGHSFGHAIEAATHFAIPHGIAVTIGMDMAAAIAAGLGLEDGSAQHRMHAVLAANYQGFEDVPIPLDPFMAALSKDKKNTGAGQVTVILPQPDGGVARVVVAADQRFRDLCVDYLNHGRRA